MSLRSLRCARRGASALTYGLVVGLVAVGAIAAVTQVGASVASLFDTVSLDLAPVAADGPSAPDLCAAADPPPIGTVCGDGSVYIGDLTFGAGDGGPAGAQRVFTTACHVGQSGAAGACGGAPSLMPYADGLTYSNPSDGSCPSGSRVEPRETCPRNWNWVDVPGVTKQGFGETTDTGGWANTLALVATDSNAVASGQQSHKAAAACAGLSVHGHDDWYLPATGEIALIQAAIDTPALSQSITDQYIASGNSCETIPGDGGTSGWACQLHSSSQSTTGSFPSNNVNWFTVSDLIVQGTKSSNRAVRCVRR